MDIVFFGSGAFAVPILRALRSTRHRLLAVVTQPDRKKGRHLRLAATPVKECAGKLGLPVLQPKDILDEKFRASLKAFDADVFVVVAYGCILPEVILSAARLMCLNVHASLLPKYRGAAPIRRALMAGEQETGITFIRMNKHMDGGDILFRKKVRINHRDDALTLDEKLSRLAGRCVSGVLTRIQSSKIRAVRQDEREASYAPKLKKEDGRIRWSDTAEKIFNLFRGCAGWPGTFTTFRGRRLNIAKCSLGKSGLSGLPGQIVSALPHQFEVACAKGTLLVEEVTPESLPKTSALSFVASYSVQTGEFLGAPPENT